MKSLDKDLVLAQQIQPDLWNWIELNCRQDFSPSWLTSWSTVLRIYTQLLLIPDVIPPTTTLLCIHNWLISNLSYSVLMNHCHLPKPAFQSYMATSACRHSRMPVLSLSLELDPVRWEYPTVQHLAPQPHNTIKPFTTRISPHPNTIPVFSLIKQWVDCCVLAI